MPKKSGNFPSGKHEVQQHFIVEPDPTKVTPAPPVLKSKSAVIRKALKKGQVLFKEDEKEIQQVLNSGGDSKEIPQAKYSEDDVAEVLGLLESSDEEEVEVLTLSEGDRRHRRSTTSEDPQAHEDDEPGELIEEGDLEDDFVQLAGGYEGSLLVVPDPASGQADDVEMFCIRIKPADEEDERMSIEDVDLSVRDGDHVPSGDQHVWRKFWNESAGGPSDDDEPHGGAVPDLSECKSVAERVLLENQGQTLERVRADYLSREGRLPTHAEEMEELQLAQLSQEMRRPVDSWQDWGTTSSMRSLVQEQCLDKYFVTDAKGKAHLCNERITELPPVEEEMKEKTLELQTNMEADDSQSGSDSDSYDEDEESSPRKTSARVLLPGGKYNDKRVWKSSIKRDANKESVTEQGCEKNVTFEDEVARRAQLKKAVPTLRPKNETSDEKRLRKKAVKDAKRLHRQLKQSMVLS